MSVQKKGEAQVSILRSEVHVRRRCTSTTVSRVCATNVHFVRSRFTGKERDAESGNDYFGARYYASTMGRFMSPDWSDPAQPVPYASLERPQSLNLYGYVENNPLSSIDDDGHSTIIYDGQAQTITFRENDGTETTFSASNNPQLALSIGKLVDGNYEFLDTARPHHHSANEDSANGAYGTHGIFRLKPFKGADGKEHDGVGVHAGRADSTDRAGRKGYCYATNGCVRTTEFAMWYISLFARYDPLTGLTVQNNRPAPKDDHGDHPSPHPGPPKPPRLIPRPKSNDGNNGGGDDN
jgi:RHS repeat-associated protein